MPSSGDGLVHFELDRDERFLLSQGLGQWGGPAGCTEELAVAMGFASVLDLLSEGKRIAHLIDSGAPMTQLDWTRALVCTEIVFASDVFGAGVEWEIVTPLDDETSLRTLRGIQRKIVQGRLPTRELAQPTQLP